MDMTFLMRLVRMLALTLIQILIFNNIHVAGYITPIMVGYMILICHRGSDRIALLLWGFVTGVLFDVFSNTPGLCTTAMTLTAMLQPFILSLCIPNDAPEDMKPSVKEMGRMGFFIYCVTLMGTLHTAFYLLDAFTLRNWLITLAAIVCGTLLSAVLSIVFEMLHAKKS